MIDLNSEDFQDGFRYAMSIVDSHSIHENLSGRMSSETYKFIREVVNFPYQFLPKAKNE